MSTISLGVCPGCAGPVQFVNDRQGGALAWRLDGFGDPALGNADCRVCVPRPASGREVITVS